MNPYLNAATMFGWRVSRVEAGIELAVRTIAASAVQAMSASIYAHANLIQAHPRAVAQILYGVFLDQIRPFFADMRAAYQEIGVKGSREAASLLNRARPKSHKESLSDVIDLNFGEDAEDGPFAPLTDDDVIALLLALLWHGLTIAEWLDYYEQQTQRRMMLLLLGNAAQASVEPNIDSAAGSLSRSVKASLDGQRKGSIANSLSRSLATHAHTVANAVWSDVIEKSGLQIETEQWSAILDGYECKQCRNLNGKIFRVSPDGVSTAPDCPLHESCRCKKIPIFSDPATEGVSFNSWLLAQPEGFLRQELGTQAEAVLSGRVRFSSLRELRQRVSIRALPIDSLQGDF